MSRALILAALLRLTHPPTIYDAARAADVLAPVALDAPLWPVPSELAPDAAEVPATALLLAAIGYHESGFQEAVGSCRLRGPGPGGGSVTHYQLLGSGSLAGWTEAEVCASNEVAARAALRVVRLHAHRCPTCVPGQWIAGYASGDMGKGSKAAREIAGIWSTLCRGAGLVCDPYATARPTWRITR